MAKCVASRFRPKTVGNTIEKSLDLAKKAAKLVTLFDEKWAPWFKRPYVEVQSIALNK